ATLDVLTCDDLYRQRSFYIRALDIGTGDFDFLDFAHVGGRLRQDGQRNADKKSAACHWPRAAIGDDSFLVRAPHAGTLSLSALSPSATTLLRSGVSAGL